MSENVEKGTETREAVVSAMRKVFLSVLKSAPVNMPEKAAELLTQLCADGKADTAVKILYLMQDRSAAKTLEAVKDPKTGADITERLQRVTKDAPAGG